MMKNSNATILFLYTIIIKSKKVFKIKTWVELKCLYVSTQMSVGIMCLVMSDVPCPRSDG
jgi:hypothetical protein